MILLSFTVLGKPVPQGSLKTIPSRFTGKPVTMHSNKKLSGWRQDVGWAALAAMSDAKLQIWSPEIPLEITITCYLEKPKSAKKSKLYPTGARNDSDKLLRAIFDAMKGVVYTDDGQVIKASVQKLYGIPQRAEIMVGPLE